jgi:hypothetical protein
MYVGVLLILLGESITFASLPILPYAVVVWLFFHQRGSRAARQLLAASHEALEGTPVPISVETGKKYISGSGDDRRRSTGSPCDCLTKFIRAFDKSSADRALRESGCRSPLL